MKNVALFSWGSVVVCLLSLALFGWTAQQRSNDVARVEEFANETRFALCTLREDLQRRYDAGVEFLERNPNGVAGLSAQDIARSLENQRATLDSLSSLECE